MCCFSLRITCCCCSGSKCYCFVCITWCLAEAFVTVWSEAFIAVTSQINGMLAVGTVFVLSM